MYQFILLRHSHNATDSETDEVKYPTAMVMVRTLNAKSCSPLEYPTSSNQRSPPFSMTLIVECPPLTRPRNLSVQFHIDKTILDDIQVKQIILSASSVK